MLRAMECFCANPTYDIQTSMDLLSTAQRSPARSLQKCCISQCFNFAFSIAAFNEILQHYLGKMRTGMEQSRMLMRVCECSSRESLVLVICNGVFAIHTKHDGFHESSLSETNEGMVEATIEQRESWVGCFKDDVLIFGLLTWLFAIKSLSHAGYVCGNDPRARTTVSFPRNRIVGSSIA
jgi:hypothetical protein